MSQTWEPQPHNYSWYSYIVKNTPDYSVVRLFPYVSKEIKVTMGAHMSCLTNITTFGKTREGFGTQIISGCHSPSFSYTLLKYVFSLRGAMVQIPLRTTVTLVANPEARRAHRTKPAYHLSSNGQLNAGRSVGRTGGRPDGRTDGRTDGRMDGQNLKKVLFWKKSTFLPDGSGTDGFFRTLDAFSRTFGRVGRVPQGKKVLFEKKDTHPSSVS